MIHLNAALDLLAGDVVPFDMSKRREHDPKLPWGRKVVPYERFQRKQTERPADLSELGAMASSYLETAAWASTHFEDQDDNSGTPIDDLIGSGQAQWSIAAVEAAKQDCQKFLELAEQQGLDLSSLDESQLGHDFFLTRNRHGAGFWDGDYPEPLGTQLTDLSHKFGESDPYLGDDKLLYFA